MSNKTIIAQLYPIAPRQLPRVSPVIVTSHMTVIIIALTEKNVHDGSQTHNISSDFSENKQK